MKIVITKQHVEDASYENNEDCPLARALKEIGFKNVFAYAYFVEIGDRVHSFDFGEWNSGIMRKINEGTLKKCILDIPTLHPL